MILLTGKGSFAQEFAGQENCDIVSIRQIPPEQWPELFSRYDVVIHNAANLKCENLEEAVNDNFLLTKNILDTLSTVNPDARFIYLSSMSMLKTEDSYSDPVSMTSYAFSKYLGELYCLRHPHLKTNCLRFSTIFYGDPGKDGLSKLIFEAASFKEITLINHGTARRDFIPLSIIVKYILKLIKTGNDSRKIYNIAAGTPTSFGEIATLLKKQIPVLQVHSKEMAPGGEILHRFSTDNLRDLGIIDFNLEAEIADYLKSIIVS